MTGIHSNQKPSYDATLTFLIRDKGNGAISFCTLKRGYCYSLDLFQVAYSVSEYTSVWCSHLLLVGLGDGLNCRDCDSSSRDLHHASETLLLSSNMPDKGWGGKGSISGGRDLSAFKN